MTEYINNCYTEFRLCEEGIFKENNLHLKYFYIVKLEGKKMKAYWVTAATLIKSQPLCHVRPIS